MPTLRSLCITTTHINNDKTFILYRLADLIGHEFVKVTKEERYNTGNPSTLFKNYVPDELCVWNWDSDDSTKKAVKEYCNLFQILKFDLFAAMNLTEIISVFKGGIYIPTALNYKALILLEELENHYTMLLLDSRNTQYNGNKLKLKSDLVEVMVYMLPKEDFISTEHIVVKGDNGEILPHKLVYKYLLLPEPYQKVELLDFKDKLSLFIKKQLKTREFTKSEKKRILQFFDEALLDFDYINKFIFEESLGNYITAEEVSHVSNIINDILTENNIWDNYNTILLENLPILRSKYYKSIENEYVVANKAYLQEFNDEIEFKQQLINELTNKENGLKESVNKLDCKLLTLEENIALLRNTEDAIKTSIKNKGEEIKQNLADFIVDIELNRLLSGSVINSENKNQSNFVILSGKNITYDLDRLDNALEAIDVLHQNLIKIGINKDFAELVSNYILSTLIMQQNLYIVGMRSLQVAKAVAATIHGEDVDIITIINPNVDYNELNKCINNSQKSVIVLENILTMNDNLALRLLKQNNKDKIFILTDELTESIKFLPKSLLCHVNLICTDYLCDNLGIEEFEYTKLISSLSLSYKRNRASINAVQESLSTITEVGFISPMHKVIKSEFVAILENNSNKTGLFTWLLCEAIPYFILNISGNLTQLIDELDLSDRNIETINKTFG